jgi:hypothetical protein
MTLPLCHPELACQRGLVRTKKAPGQSGALTIWLATDSDLLVRHLHNFHSAKTGRNYEIFPIERNVID